MPSQDTFGKVRLKEKVESRVRGRPVSTVRRRVLETYRVKTRKGAGYLAYGLYGERGTRERQFLHRQHPQQHQ